MTITNDLWYQKRGTMTYVTAEEGKGNGLSGSWDGLAGSYPGGDGVVPTATDRWEDGATGTPPHQALPAGYWHAIGTVPSPYRCLQALFLFEFCCFLHKLRLY